MFDRFKSAAMLMTGGVILLALPRAARASEPSPTTIVRVVLADGDTLRAASVRPASFDMIAVEMPDSKVRYLASNRVRAVLDSRGVDRIKAVLEGKESVPSHYDLEMSEWERSPVGDRPRRVRTVTWRGRPLAETRSFMITEFGMLVRIDDYPYAGSESRTALTFDLGWMKNISKNGAVGFTGYAMASDPTRMGIRARYRRWLSPKTSIDISPGVMLGGEDGGIEYDPPGFVLGATLNAGDLVALTVDAEYARNRDLVHDTLPLQWENRTDIAWRAGAKLGSGLGVLATASLFGLLIAIGASGGFD